MVKVNMESDSKFERPGKSPLCDSQGLVGRAGGCGYPGINHAVKEAFSTHPLEEKVELHQT